MTRGVVTVLSLIVVAAFGIAAGAIYARLQLGEQRREQQISVNKRIADASLENCKEIEKLKSAQRERALEQFKHLDANLRLLHIPKTPAVVEAAQESLHRDLARFAAAPCPRR